MTEYKPLTAEEIVEYRQYATEEPDDCCEWTNEDILRALAAVEERDREIARVYSESIGRDHEHLSLADAVAAVRAADARVIEERDREIGQLHFLRSTCPRRTEMSYHVTKEDALDTMRERALKAERERDEAREACDDLAYSCECWEDDYTRMFDENVRLRARTERAEAKLEAVREWKKKRSPLVYGGLTQQDWLELGCILTTPAPEEQDDER